MRIASLACLLLVPGALLAAQTQSSLQENDVLFLKSGQVIVGRIVQLIPDSTVRIVTLDGVERSFHMSDVDKIEKWQRAGTAVPVSGMRKKEPCLGCLFSWVIPGAGMVYAGEYNWAALYFCVNTPLAVWAVVENAKVGSPYYRDEVNWTPILLLLPLRLIEYGHTLAVIDRYNKKHGLALSRGQPGTLAGVEYRLPGSIAPNEARIELANSLDGRSVRLGLRAGF